LSKERERLLHHSKDVPLESISKMSERIESYLRHTLEDYENSLNRKKHGGVQTDNSAWPDQRGASNQTLKHDHEENNRRVINELKVLSQHLLDYNRRTFEKFMLDIKKDYRERVTANEKMHYEIEDLKKQRNLGKPNQKNNWSNLCKNNNLHRDLREVRRARDQLQQDLVREQRRRCDAEAEHDNEIIRRQNAEGVEKLVIDDLHQLRTNGRNQVNRMLDRIARKQNRIGELVQENLPYDCYISEISPPTAE
ncbi:13465_t:CDS:2, partial [Acaulospora colombiana]